MSFSPFGARPEALGFKGIAATILLHDAVLTALAVYLVWRAGDGLAAIGWKRAHFWREVMLGVVLFVPFMLCVALLEAALRAAGLPPPPGPPPFLLPRSNTDYLVAFVLLVVVAIAEETVFRGYLLLRFAQITGSRGFAVALSSGLFALGHAYQGSLGVIAVGVNGVGIALIYFWRGSLVAPMVMHFIQNGIGLLVAPRFLDV